MIREVTYYETPRAQLGEGPVWDVAKAQLTWVDARDNWMFRLDTKSGKVTQKQLPHSPGGYALREGGGIIMAYRDQLEFLDANWETIKVIPTPDIAFDVELFNDAACDRLGRFWVGTLERKISEPLAHLFCINRNLEITEIESDLICSNGIAFSPDDKFLYHIDTEVHLIFRYDFDLASGAVSNRIVFLDLSDAKGLPDGCTIDAEGHLWVADFSCGSVFRVAPNGSIVETIKTPVSKPTSVAFGGPDMRTLYITSMRLRLTPEQLEEQPYAGGLISYEVDVPGLPEPLFAG